MPALHINLSSELWPLADDGSSGDGGSGGGNENELYRYESKLPKLSGNMAKQFLSCVYNDSAYGKLDLSSDKYYQLLTGDYSNVTSVEELKQRIWAFSTFVRTSMNQQVSDASYRVDYLSEELCSYLQEELKGMSNIDEQIVSEYLGKVNKLFQEEIEDILCGVIAQNVGIIITENTMESVKLTVSAYNDFANLSNEISDYVNRIAAVIEGSMYVLNNDIKGRTMYFNSYLRLEQCMNISQHEYTSEVIKPTCSERGYTRYQCTLCGKTYNNDYVDALGHDFSKKIISNDYLESPATCKKQQLIIMPAVNAEPGERLYLRTEWLLDIVIQIIYRIMIWRVKKTEQKRQSVIMDVDSHLR